MPNSSNLRRLDPGCFPIGPGPEFSDEPIHEPGLFTALFRIRRILITLGQQSFYERVIASFLSGIQPLVAGVMFLAGGPEIGAFDTLSKNESKGAFEGIRSAGTFFEKMT